MINLNLLKGLVYKVTQFIALVFPFFVGVNSINAQCGFIGGDGCANTNYANFAMSSDNNAATIEYDNFVSAYHSSAVRESDGTLYVWGSTISNTGANVLAPLAINSTNFPALGTARPLKVTLGSSGNDSQGILLASNGLYAWGVQGTVINAGITSNNTFQKITIGGNTTGLPSGVSPSNVKMMQATRRILVITTCDGFVWVLSDGDATARGNGGTGNNTTWSQVQTAPGVPLSNIVACRAVGGGTAGNNTLIALAENGTLWTWGGISYLGDNSAPLSRTRATQMASIPGITPKMIAVTLHSYYVLATNGNLYSLGQNASRQLGNWLTAESRTWIQPRYNSSTGPVMNNIKWISAQEHDRRYSSVNVLTNDSILFAWGDNNTRMIGATSDPSNPVIPQGINATDRVLAVESGGHTTMVVKLCATNFGYVGHRVNGSMGNGSSASGTESSYQFNTAPVAICGAESNPAIQVLPPVVNGPLGNLCVSEPVTLSGTPAGGTFSVLSGPGFLVGDSVLNFTGVGTVVVQYELAADLCTGVVEFVNREFVSENCFSDLSVVKTVNDISPSYNDTITFTITVTNNGADEAENVVVTDIFTNGFTYVSDNSGGFYNPATGLWTVGNLLNGESAVLEIQAIVNLNLSANFSNTASVSANQFDTIPGNNSSVVIVVPNNIIVATNDFFNCANGNLGQSSVVNVFNNDSINNLPLNPTEVILSVLTTDPGLVLQPNGNINVLPGTLEGTYSLTYQICEIINPTNCDIATVNVTVSPFISLVSTSFLSDCGANDGSLELSGLIPLSTYTLFFNANSQVITPNTSNFILTGLPNGSYNVSVQNSDNCISNIMLNVQILEPGPPSAPLGIGCN